jgi:hypothetical protein
MRAGILPRFRGLLFPRYSARMPRARAALERLFAESDGLGDLHARLADFDS